MTPMSVRIIFVILVNAAVAYSLCRADTNQIVREK